MKTRLLCIAVLFCTLAHGQNAITASSILNVSINGQSVQTTSIVGTNLFSLVRTADGRVGYTNGNETIYFKLPDDNAASDGLALPDIVYREAIGNPSTTIGNLNDAIRCDNCLYSVAHVATTGTQTLTDLGAIQTFNGTTLAAYVNSDAAKPWLEATAPTTIAGLASLSLSTANAQFPTNMRGEIDLNLGNGTTFGISTTGQMLANLGWKNNPEGIITINGGTIRTSATFIDSGLISATAVFISDHPGDKIGLPPGIQAMIASNSLNGAGFLISSDAEGPLANASITLRQGAFSNSIRTTSTIEEFSSIGPGTFYFESTSPGGIRFNTAPDAYGDAGPIAFVVNNIQIAKADVDGFTVYGQAFNLPCFSTEQMKALENPQLGGYIFNTTLDAPCVRTKKGWKKVKVSDIP